MILITGATGNTGREISRLLKDAGIAFKAMARSRQSQALLEEQGIETVHGDFDDPVSLQSALKGITRAYLVCTPDEKMVEREVNFIEASVKAGVGRIVKLSGLLASSTGETPNLRAHGRIEEALAASALRFTVLRPHGFFQTLYFMSQPLIAAKGIMTYPAADSRASHVDLRDVAQAAFVVLTADGGEHDGKVYDITGPAAVSFQEMADTLSDALGKKILYIPGREEEMAGFLKMLGVADQAVAHVVGIFRMMREDRLSFVTDTLERLGVKPTSLREFASDISSGRTGIATSFKMPPGAGDPADLMRMGSPPGFPI